MEWWGPKSHPEPNPGRFIHILQVPVPQITKFTITSRWWLATGALMTLLTYVTLSPPLSSIVPSYLYAGSFIRDIVGDGVVKLAWGTVVVMHTAESFYTAKLVKRHGTPFGVGVSSPSLIDSPSLISLSSGHVHPGNPLVRLPSLDGAEEERPDSQD